MGLSSYPGISLTKARELAKKHAKLVSLGIDPKTELRRLASKARAEANQHVTFREFAETHFIPKKQTDYKGANQVRRLQQLLRDYVYPHIGSLRINEIDLGKKFGSCRLANTKAKKLGLSRLLEEL